MNRSKQITQAGAVSRPRSAGDLVQPDAPNLRASSCGKAMNSAPEELFRSYRLTCMLYFRQVAFHPGLFPSKDESSSLDSTVAIGRSIALDRGEPRPPRTAGLELRSGHAGVSARGNWIGKGVWALTLLALRRFKIVLTRWLQPLCWSWPAGVPTAKAEPA